MKMCLYLAGAAFVIVMPYCRKAIFFQRLHTN